MTMAPTHERSGEVLGITLLAFAVVGMLLLVAGLLSSNDFATLTRPESLVTLPAYFLGTVAPAGLPAALAGAHRAAQDLERVPPGRTLGFWIRRGIRFGAPLGALNVAVVFGIISAIGRAEHLPRTIVVLAMVGAVTGALVAAPVGAYCWTVSRAAR